MFSDIVKQLKLSSKKLVLDCCTRWNATYFMLSAALEFKDVFPRYQQRDPLYTSLPSEEEWKRVQVVCSFLREFHELTKLISGSEYPTANLFLTELVQIKKFLKNETQDTFMKEMIKKMKTKFEKYWGSCNLLICIATVLDSRNKMRVIKWCAKDTMSEADGVELIVTVRETLRHLYDEYVENSKVNVGETSTIEPLREECSINVPLEQKSRHDFESYISDNDCVIKNSVLDLYLEELVVKWRKPTSFDAIMWWKMNNSKYKTLSRMACDVLSIPITTVASESTFSADGRVIDPRRTSLSVNTVQMLLCAGDWLRSHYDIKGKARLSVIFVSYTFLHFMSNMCSIFKDKEDKEGREVEEINLT
ncbi:hypothetical protein C2S53_000471 [Perilla frutescens var. hirtella]|uniref:Zinc finger BED domain-containing protein RICESLEEPER 2-like n=1 Tax=Perilla frutescens var. hirtella TaxID=608512 RepID=A0AAD4PAM2_PERFH|nr:hypothetical protein C2S53_000471 [Perilla frutescens var. hirtella]